MARFSVCPRCEGEGYVGTLGAYTADEMHEQFLDHEDYVEAHEASKVPCECCKGKRVVTMEDLDEYREAAEYEAERRAEQRWGY